MPRYEFLCPDGHAVDLMLYVADRDSEQHCAVCGKLMQRVFSAPMVVIWQGRWRDQWRDGPDGYDDGLGPQAE